MHLVSPLVNRRGSAARAALVATIAGVSLILGWPMSAATARPARSPACVAQPVTRALDAQLIAAFRRAAELPRSVRLRITGAQHYGHCATTGWAWAEVSPRPHQRLTYREQVSLQDHSVIYEHRRGGTWVNLGVGPLCGPGALPRAMARAWHERC